MFIYNLSYDVTHILQGKKLDRQCTMNMKLNSDDSLDLLALQNNLAMRRMIFLTLNLCQNYSTVAVSKLWQNITPTEFFPLVFVLVWVV